MLVGLNGAGKTTNGAKLAGFMKKHNGKRPLLVACDTFRPAAITQLEVVGSQVDVPVFQMGQIDPIDIAKAGIEHAKKHGNDMVFLDTAGRLHVDEALMDELRAVKAAVDPTEILLVVALMERAAPPRASPSSLVSMTPVMSRASSKALAAFTASWPIMASTTRRISWGSTAAFMTLS